jgi:hypothetical protein
VNDREIHWSLTSQANRWVQELLMLRLQQNEITDRVLAHLMLKGNFIWSGKDAEQRHLDGEVFGRPNSAGRTGIGLPPPSGDDRKGGDFEMWFWLAQRSAAGPIIEFGVTGRDIRGVFRAASGAPLPGMTVTLIPTPLLTTGPRTTQTDANGAFAFVAIPPGSYTLSVNVGGVTVTRPVVMP